MGGWRRGSSARDRVGAVLAQVLAQPDPLAAPRSVREDPSVLALPDLVPAAVFHRVAPALYAALRGEESLPASARAALTAEHHDQMFRHAAALASLRQLAAVFDGIGCRWAVVKGPYLAEYVHARPDLRTYVDLDVVVDHRALPTVVAGLQEAGAAFLDRNWTLIRDDERAQTSLQLGPGPAIDLHWHLINRGRVRHAFALDMDSILDRARPVTLGRVQAPALDDVDALVHLCLHATIAGGAKLVWLHDVHALFTRHPVDEQTLVDRARAGGAGVAVAVILQRARHTLGTPVSDGLLDALARRRGWRAVTGLVDTVRPVAMNDDRRGTGRTVIRATRATDLASAREFRLTATRNVWARVVRDSSRLGHGSEEFADDGPDLLAQVGGSDRDRDEFFAWVSAASEF